MGEKTRSGFRFGLGWVGSQTPWVWLRREVCNFGTSLAEISIHLRDVGHHFDRPQPFGKIKFYFWCANSLRSWLLLPQAPMLLLLPSWSVGTEAFKCLLPLIWGAFCCSGTKQVRGREPQTNNRLGTSECFWFTLKKKNREGKMNSKLGSLSMSRKWAIKSSCIFFGGSRCLLVGLFVLFVGFCCYCCFVWAF